MSNFTPPLLALLAVLAAALLRRRRGHRPRHSCNRTTQTTLPAILHLLHGRATALPPLLSRALPNRRLQTTFGISNSFTTSSPATHRAFLAHTKHLLATCAALAPDASPLTPCTPLAPAVRDIVLRAIVRSLFPRADAAAAAVAVVAEEVNALWIASKTPGGGDDAVLRAALAQVFPADEEVAPLNLILPAYETLWRAAVCCFMELRFRSQGGGERAEWRAAVVGGAVASDGAGAREIVLETLRLYPPTRRVHRAMNADGDVIEAADVEAVQRDATIWGPDVDEFRPGRWCGRSDAAEGGFVAFGGGAFVCPAKKGFAGEAVASVVKALLQRVGDGVGVRLVDGKGEEVEVGGEVLKRGRGGWEGWRVVGWEPKQE